MKHKLLKSILLCALPFAAQATDFDYTYEGQTITYTILDEEAKTCAVKSYNSVKVYVQLHISIFMSSKLLCAVESEIKLIVW